MDLTCRNVTTQDEKSTAIFHHTCHALLGYWGELYRSKTVKQCFLSNVWIWNELKCIRIVGSFWGNLWIHSRSKKKASVKNEEGINVNLLSASVFLLSNGRLRWPNQLECTTMSDYQHVRSSGHFDCSLYFIIPLGIGLTHTSSHSVNAIKKKTKKTKTLHYKKPYNGR